MSTKILDTLHSASSTNPTSTVTLVTHKGRFHSDDVMATAILRFFFDSRGIPTKTIRTYTPEKEGYTDDTPNCIVYDIGLGQYDHHQADEAAKHTYRFDVIGEGVDKQTLVRKYAAVGLIWKEIGEPWIGSKKLADEIYERVIKYIDDTDNGFAPNPFSSLIHDYNPKNGDDKIYNTAFEEAVNMAYRLISRTIEVAKSKKESIDKLTAIAVKDAPYIITPEFMEGADDVCREYNIPFYIYPNDRIENGWCIKTINKYEGNNSIHIKDIPDEVRNWKDVTFLHPSCFLAACIGAERACEIATMLANK